MKGTTRLIFFGKFPTIGALLASGLLTFATLASAQGGQGQDAVYLSGGVVGSQSFIDASMFAQSGADFCKVLNIILSSAIVPYPSSGAVIDARGLPNSTPPTSMKCAASPWNGIANPPPATILLPATSGATPTPIIIYTPWIIPSNTHLIGEGDGIGSSAATTIQVSSPTFNPTAGYILQFGSASGASGISVERLTIDGLGNAVNGIVNPNAGPNSYVDHVTLYQIRGIGLLVENNADGSGPYSNITFNTGSYGGTTATACAQISNVTSATNSSASGGTRGIHGLVCSSNSPDAPAGVLLDSSNNTIEDVKIVGFYDGVLVGSNAIAQSNVLINVIGDTTAMSVTPVIAVDISNNHPGTGDLAIIGVSNSSLSGTYTIMDNFTMSTPLSDPYVGIYALGEAPGIGYSRFTTSPSVATWASGPSAPTAGSSCTTATTSPLGSLFSNTGTTGATLWVCRTNGTWGAVSTN